MKKNYLLLLLLSFLLTGNVISQVLWQDDFESYDEGNFTDSNGWVREEGLDEWAQIVTLDTVHNKSLRLFAPIANEIGMFVTHQNNWAGRTPGNEVFEASFDFYSGNEVVEGLGQVVIATPDFYEIVSIGMLSGDTNIFIYADGLDTTLVSNVQPDTWYHITITYNSTTGEVIAQANGGEKIFGSGTAGLEPEIFDLTALLASDIGIDNITVLANKTSTLSAPNVSLQNAKLYPNPVLNNLNILTGKAVAATCIIDITGRTVREFSNETQLVMQDLPAGYYTARIVFEDGTSEVQKFIKQ